MDHVLVRERELHAQMSCFKIADNLGPQPRPLRKRGVVGHGPSASSPQAHSDEDGTQDDHPPHGGDALVWKKVSSFVYMEELVYVNMPPLGDARCFVAVADYIALARDFASGVKSVAWGPIHEHMMASRPQGQEFFKKGKLVGSAADFIFLDLPSVDARHALLGHAAWDICTEDHVRHGVALSCLTLADSGWLLIMASFGGDSIGWVERYCRVSDLEIVRRIVVLLITCRMLLMRWQDLILSGTLHSSLWCIDVGCSPLLLWLRVHHTLLH